jgi:dienelactone hydrolase
MPVVDGVPDPGPNPPDASARVAGVGAAAVRAALPADRLTGPTLAVLTRTAAAAVALPTLAAWVAGQSAAGLVHRLAARLPEPAPPPLPTPPAPAADMDEAMARVLAVPSSPAPRRIAALARTGLPDLPLALVSTVPALSSLGWRYPRVFRPRSLPGADGEPMAALVALQPIGPAPALIVAHGATTTKAFDYVRRACLRAYAAGFHVLAPDLRGYGVTGLIAEAPTSLGAEEGRDLLAAADWLRERGATSVAAVGYSLGGAAVLSAARRDPRAGGLDGGALAVSAPTDLWATLQHISTRPRLRDPAFFNWLALRADAIARAARQAGPTSRSRRSSSSGSSPRPGTASTSGSWPAGRAPPSGPTTSARRRSFCTGSTTWWSRGPGARLRASAEGQRPRPGPRPPDRSAHAVRHPRPGLDA